MAKLKTDLPNARQRAVLTGLSAVSLAAWLANSQAFAMSCEVYRKIFIRLLSL
jgi:hypothetical protein